jgi:hypothetical protein
MSYDGFSIYKIEEMTGINSKPMQWFLKKGITFFKIVLKWYKYWVFTSKLM